MFHNPSLVASYMAVHPPIGTTERILGQQQTLVLPVSECLSVGLTKIWHSHVILWGFVSSYGSLKLFLCNVTESSVKSRC